MRQIFRIIGRPTQAGWRRRLSYAVTYAFLDIKSDMGPVIGALDAWSQEENRKIVIIEIIQ